VINAKASFERAKQIYGRERFSRPRPETIECKLRRLAGLHVHEQVIVFLLRACAFPIEIQWVALGYFDVPSDREGSESVQRRRHRAADILRRPLRKAQSCGRAVEDDDVQVFRVGCDGLVGILISGMAPMPERQKVGCGKR